MSLISYISFSLACQLAFSHALSIQRRTPSTPKKIIVQMFEWNWESVATECTNFIGPAGYGYVQVSPPTEEIQGPQWWTSYQPVSHELNSKRGTRAQFAKMVATCRSAGVGVIADTLWNHMSSSSGTGTAGNSFSKYDYPGLYQTDDFHHNCGQPDGQIHDYTNRTEVQFCELNSLADLATETEHVRSSLAAYGNDLLSLGVDGFRLDAAKHIPSADIANVLSRLAKRVYVTQEVIWGPNEAIQPSEYTNNGDVQEFRYTSALRDAFAYGNIAPLADINTRGWIDSSRANIFVANHDTERTGASLNYRSPNNQYALANVFALSFPYGTPTVLSSYQFGGYDDGAPNGGSGSCSGSGGADGWLCQHRSTAIAGMAGFFNQVSTSPLNKWVSGSPAQIAYGRGSSGFVVINSGGSPWSSTFTTSLRDGTYCDVISGGMGSGSCAGLSITISKGSFNITTDSYSAIAIHNGAMDSAAPGSGSAPPSNFWK